MGVTDKKTKKTSLNVLVFLGAILAIILLVIEYLHIVQTEEQIHADNILHESATQSVALIREHFSNEAERIEQIGYYLGQHEVSITLPEVIGGIQDRAGIATSFTSITIATADGSLYGREGKKEENISNHVHFKAAMEGNTTISNVEHSLDSNDNSIYMTAPIKRKGEIIGVVDAQFLMSSLIEYLSVESFEGRGYSYMANADGHIFVWANHPDVDYNFTNIYENFNENTAISTVMIEKMRKNMQEGKTGQVSYQWAGKNRTMNYMPVGINDWYLLSVLPNEVVTSRAVMLTRQVLMLTGTLLIILLALVFYLNRARRKDQKILTEVHQELLTIYNAIPSGVFKCRMDEKYTLVEANDGFYRFIGYTREECMKQFSNELVRLMQPEDVRQVKKSIAEQICTGETSSDEVRFIDSQGKEKCLLLSGKIIQNEKGEKLVYCCFTDITELKQTQEKLREATMRYELIMGQTQDIIFEWNPQSRNIHHSKIYEKKFGYTLSGENFPESVIEKGLVPKEDQEQFLDIYRKVETGSPEASGEFRIGKADGSFLWCRVSVTAVLDEQQQLCRVIGIIKDIDKERRELDAITEKAQCDLMTGLYNKKTTEQFITGRLSGNIKSAVLLMIDIDNFKNVNDTLGHTGGDTALTEVAHQLKQLFRKSDIVGRIGGDEFLVFIDSIKLGKDLEQKLAAISEVFNWSFCKNKLEYFISCSIGVAVVPKDGNTYQELVKKADAALYFAKRNGKNQVAIYSEEMQKTTHGVQEEEVHHRC